MNTIRMMAIALPMTLLLACGGGGGGGTASVTPTTPPTGGGGGEPIELQALPTALITDIEPARLNFLSNPVTTPFTSTEIQQMFRSRASNGDRLVASDVFLVTPGISGGADTSTNCTATSCGDITIDGNTFTLSLANVATGIGSRFELMGFNFEYSPIMDYRGIIFTQHRAAGRNNDSDVFEHLSYGGWLADSAFSVDMLTINDGSNESSLLVGVSYGDATGSRPTGTTGQVVWSGAAVGIRKSDGHLFQGNTEIIINDIASNTTINTITISNIGNLSFTTSLGLSTMLWQDVPIEADGTFSSTTGGDIDGAFYGDGHTEIGGTFNRDGIIGAFGGTRQ